MEERGDTCETLTCADYVSVNWQMKERYPELRNHLGNMNTDPIADMLTRIRNAQMVKKDTVEIPYSKMKYAIAQILERRGFVRSVELKGRTIKRVIEL